MQLWQTDITQTADFGRLKHVHVSIDTFPHAIVATAHAGERAVDVIRHFQKAFSVLGVPQQIKTDNGSGYVSQKTAFLR